MRGEGGYSLVEVIVAFAILAGTLLMGLDAFRGGLANLHRAERQLDMAQLAKTELMKLSLEPGLQAGSRHGESGSWSWRAEIGGPPDGGIPSSLRMLRLKVFVNEAGDVSPEVEVLDTILLPLAPAP